MSEREQRAVFEETLKGLVVAMRADFDMPTYTMYWRALKDVLPALLASAVVEAAKTMRFMPKPAELRALCEVRRRQLLALHPWTPCVECHDNPRWRAVLIDDVERVQKCPCVARHAKKLEDMGIGTPIAALPSTASEGPAEQDYPTREQLPEAVRSQFGDIVHRKVIR